MPANVTEYDPELLASAPEATKAQVQSGYAVDLLDGRDHPGRPTVQPGDPEAARPHSKAGKAVPTSPIKAPRPPFYRTRRGIIIIIVAFVASVAVIVGGAVGGVKSHSSQTGPVQSSSPQTTADTLSDPFPGGVVPTPTARPITFVPSTPTGPPSPFSPPSSPLLPSGIPPFSTSFAGGTPPTVTP